MITANRLDVPASASDSVVVRSRTFLSTLNWSAIFGGTLAAMGIHILLSALGVGAGLGTFSPQSDQNPVINFSVGSAIIWTICALVSLGVGGVLAGRFSHSLHGGFVHGMLVWAMTLVITILIVSVGGGMVMGGAIKMLGEGAKTVAPISPDIAADGTKRSTDQMTSFTDEAMQYLPAGTAPQTMIHARREINFTVAKLFSPANSIDSPENRSSAIQSLVDNTQMSQTDATRLVDSWILSAKKLYAELEHTRVVAEQKARVVVDQAASNLATAAIWSFVALLIGLLVTSLAGSFGASKAMFHAAAVPVVS